MKRRAFTLIELLVVVGIIAVLLSILMPALSRAKQQANETACASNLRQIMLAFKQFSIEHNDCLPGSSFDINNPDPDKTDWLQGTQVGTLSAAPDQGTLFRYLNSYKIYRCPALRTQVNTGGLYSNGKFDYCAFIVWTGAKAAKIPTQARFTFPDGHQEMHLTPVIVEEDPSVFMNSGANIEGGHSSGDRFAGTHHGGSNYAALDGSVHWFSEPAKTDSTNWEAMSPGGKWTSMGTTVITWGWWNAQ